MALLLGVFALGTPLLVGRLAFLFLGSLVLIFGLLQNFTGFALRDPEAGSWFARGGSSILTGLLLIAMPKLTFAGLALLLGLSWIISGGSAIVAAIGRSRPPDWHWHAADGLVNLALGLAIALQWPVTGIVSVGLCVGLRYVSAGWSILVGAPPAALTQVAEAGLHPDKRLGLAPHPYIAKLRDELANEEMVRSRVDRGWCWLFLFTFFAIHAARMDTDWNLVGMLSPVGAVLGDVLIAIFLAYALVAPISTSWRGMTRSLERRGWNWYLARADRGERAGIWSRAVGWWLARRMRKALRRSQARGSATAAMGWGLRAGLPAVAILMALTPLWGVSWFFNTETWVTGAWEVWAEKRTDTWRVQMVQAVKEEYGAAAGELDFFRVVPDGVSGVKDFSFVVIGDTGEGDASQHILRDQLLLLGQKPEVKFLVVSSDVIYPSGAMKDYEPKFYLPFKGFHKPIYAVPGNHDWYDALESFTANFLEPKAARVALRARREADLRLTTTTEARIDSMIEQAEFLRREYQIRAALQRAPYFEMLADQFSLIAVDTGILRRVDVDQFHWLEGALERARDRFKLVILGHPLYAAGRYQAEGEEGFAKVHALLKKHAVDVVMGGDTHDFEYYKENYTGGENGRSMYHFVNGGGGAYLSIGTALNWPKQPPVQECGFYPRADALTASLDANTSTWKRPLWYWVKHLDAWPSSPEAVASAFNYDRAPFFQSVMEVRVEASTNTVRFWLYGASGRLRWRDLHVHDERIPNGQASDDLVEFSFALRAKNR
ncbi:MAG: metallophosphoesterase [Gemmataceae bacterium]|nr:metallophosphoesterase [Gemmataceae bacterium]